MHIQVALTPDVPRSYGVSQPSSESTRPSWLASLAAIDVRSLAAFRIMLGALIFWDQCIALTNVRAFYTDDGILPRAFLLTHRMIDGSAWSLHMLAGSVFVQSLLIIVAMCAAVAVILGWRTRWALLIAWALIGSMHTRNPTITYGGDTVLRVMTFWCLFLPMNARWSLDARSGRAEVAGTSFFGISSLAILFQVAFIYWFTAVLKFGNEWTRDYSAVYYVLCADQFVLEPGLLLLRFPRLCHALSFFVWWLEWLGPFVAFIPWRNAWWRVLLIALMWIMHVGFALCLRIGYFPVAMFSIWLLFMPGMVWDWLGRKWSTLRSVEDTSTARPTWHRHAAEAFALICLSLVLLWNMWTVNAERWAPLIPSPIRSLTVALKLDQNWALFAPTPVTDDGWMICEAELYDGSHIDLIRDGRTVNFDKPHRISSEYPDWKWHKLQVNLVADSYESLRVPVGDYLARDWCERHPQGSKVRAWTLWFMREQTLPHYMAVAPQKVKLGENRLFIAPK